MNKNNFSINQIFSEKVKKSIPQHLSFIDEVAALLNLNYDAAYRRMTGKVNFSLEEAVLLAKNYDISLNDLFKVGDINSFLVTKSETIKTIRDFQIYIERVKSEMITLTNKNDAHILFASRELPMFYFFNDTELIKFKFYIWYNLINVTPIKKRISYTDFFLPEHIIENVKDLGKMYSQINKIEIWSFGALNNVLQQVIYFFKLRLISKKQAEEICYQIKLTIEKIQDTIRHENKKTSYYKLYNNDVIMNNNAMILNYKGIKRFVYPYTLLKFFTITDQNECNEQEKYFLDQLDYCTNIGDANLKESTLFFNHKYDKIAQCLQVINNINEQPIFL